MPRGQVTIELPAPCMSDGFFTDVAPETQPGARTFAAPEWTQGSRAALWRRCLSSLPFHFFLFALTIFTTLVVGVHLELNYARHLAAFDLDLSTTFFTRLARHPGSLIVGAPFSFTLLGILLAHELGHYFACRRYHIDASYPYFLPAPTLIGTLGAFIRIKSPIATRRALFDVGIAGPLAGFVVAIPALIVGISQSRVAPAAGSADAVTVGHPLAIILLAHLLHPGASVARLSLSPVGCAAWVGLFATALNLLPMGQLDGGHILYAVLGSKHKVLSRGFFLTLLPLGVLCWAGWIVWAAIMLVLGLRHPTVLIPAQPLGRGRKYLALAAALIFILCFVPTPFTVR